MALWGSRFLLLLRCGFGFKRGLLVTAKNPPETLFSTATIFLLGIFIMDAYSKALDWSHNGKRFTLSAFPFTAPSQKALWRTRQRLESSNWSAFKSAHADFKERIISGRVYQPFIPWCTKKLADNVSFDLSGSLRFEVWFPLTVCAFHHKGTGNNNSAVNPVLSGNNSN